MTRGDAAEENFRRGYNCSQAVLLAFADLTGLDFVLTALIFVLFLDKWDRREDRPSALIGLGAAVVCLAVFGQDSFIIPAMGVILAALLLGRNRLCR